MQVCTAQRNMENKICSFFFVIQNRMAEVLCLLVRLINRKFQDGVEESPPDTRKT